MAKTLGVGLWSLQPMSFMGRKPDQELFRAVAEMGVDIVDFMEDYVPCHPHLDFPAADRVKRQIAGYGLKAGDLLFF